jgi:hypothetical protein
VIGPQPRLDCSSGSLHFRGATWRFSTTPRSLCVGRGGFFENLRKLPEPVTEGSEGSKRDFHGRVGGFSGSPEGLLARSRMDSSLLRGDSSIRLRASSLLPETSSASYDSFSNWSPSAVQQAREIPREACVIDREAPRDSSSTRRSFRVGSRSFRRNPQGFCQRPPNFPPGWPANNPPLWIGY